MKVNQLEDFIAERILVTTQPQPNPERLAVARTLLAAALGGLALVDLAELRRVAASSDYEVSDALERLIADLSAL